MKSVFLHQTITNHDAIGNDIAHMYEILGRKDKVSVYCDYLLNKKLKRINLSELLDFISDENNLLIYNHSMHWEEGEEILEKVKAKVIIRYHNITPDSFFKPYNGDYYLKCKKGREQTVQIYQKHDDFLWMADSFYNFADAGICGSSNTVVVPPFTNVEQWQNITPNEAILKSLLESRVVSLLFVGRIVPNKFHKFMIEIIKDYVSHYDDDIVLYIIGKKDEALHIYNQELEELVAAYGVGRHVIWVGEISDPDLLSYYLSCNFYLNCSKHEGFCIPIIEAQKLCLPVIAKRSSAVSETIGKEQVLLGNDVREYSTAIHILSENESYRDYLVKKGLENYRERFANPVIEDKFMKIVQEFVGVPL